MSTGSKVVVTQKPGALVDPLSVIQTLVDQTQQLVVEVQKAAAERAAIAAWEHTQVAKIRAQREVLLKALELTFDERRENFRRLFAGLDTVLASGDTAQAASVLEAITDLARESPFKELANLEIIVTELKRPDQVWDV